MTAVEQCVLIEPSVYLIQSEIESLEAKLKLLRDRKVEIVACIVAEEESIKSVEEELADERSRLISERNAFQERQNKLMSQQVRSVAVMLLMIIGNLAESGSAEK